MDENILKALEAAVAEYGSRRQVTGIDYGFKYVNGQRTETPAIRIHVVVKRDPGRLVAGETFPDQIMGVPVDVLERNYVPSIEGLQGAPASTLPAAAERVDPLMPGISISHRLCPSGTLGAFVRDRETGDQLLLTNWHVVADSSFAKVGDPITQPGGTDGGVAADAIATLTRSMLNANGDAAVAKLLGNRATDPAIRELGVIPTRIRDPKLRETVVKSGRTTGVTKGLVEGVEGMYYPIYRTRDQVGIKGFFIVPLEPGNVDNVELSSNGDSGSLWLAEGTDEVVGLHFAGDRDPAPGAEVAIACFATRVFDELNITLA